MNEFYLNHSVFINQSREAAHVHLSELVKVVHFLKESGRQLWVSPNFWSVPLENNTLSLNQLVYNLSNRDEARIIISTTMDSGPHYIEVEELEDSISISPSISVQNEHVNYLLHTCFHQRQESVMSMKDESFLLENKYIVNNSAREVNVQNFLGLDALGRYFEGAKQPASISEVFELIESEFPNIIILESAKKGARKHNFQNQFQAVYDSIVALDQVELPGLLDGYVSEERKQIYYETVGYEISEESTKTMQMRSCVSEREFRIPDKGTEIFEWHIKIGRFTRIHYYIDRSERKVYIGHCGKHLRTSKH
ncbi:hypothetical protein [Bacillus cereus]|uniref:hypothetical protein n=1 Tax=Bacillus cereus TaxID=1396 RepID=UPI000BFBB135|nr:hypothetical protein [Bacillus cereus]PGW26861.1 hypothetical protein COD88_15320 [Bacillus cereus]